MPDRRSPSSFGRPVFPSGDHKWTLGLRRIDPADYFAPSPDQATALAERSRWLADDPARYAKWLPTSDEPLRETCRLLKFDIADISSHECLLALGKNCEQDLVWLQPDERGDWCVVGGVVCFPSEWGLEAKLGRTLAETHGPVPQLNEQLGGRIDAFFAGFDAGAGWARMNWSLTADAERNHHPAMHRPKLTAETSPAEVFVRWEHQLLLRLPRSGAILFAIRIELQPLTELKVDSDGGARLAHLLETMHPGAAAYKSVALARDRVMAYLRTDG